MVLGWPRARTSEEMDGTSQITHDSITIITLQATKRIVKLDKNMIEQLIIILLVNSKHYLNLLIGDE